MVFDFWVPYTSLCFVEYVEYFLCRLKVWVFIFHNLFFQFPLYVPYEVFFKSLDNEWKYHWIGIDSTLTFYSLSGRVTTKWVYFKFTLKLSRVVLIVLASAFDKFYFLKRQDYHIVFCILKIVCVFVIIQFNIFPPVHLLPSLQNKKKKPQDSKRAKRSPE